MSLFLNIVFCNAYVGDILFMSLCFLCCLLQCVCRLCPVDVTFFVFCLFVFCFVLFCCCFVLMLSFAMRVWVVSSLCNLKKKRFLLQCVCG